MKCPLCQSADTTLLLEPRHQGRQFSLCHHCGLSFVPEKFHLSEPLERARYETHENHPEDPHYRKFFLAFVEALVPRLRPGSVGLDFGAGPGPALAAMLQERGFRVSLYDKYFHPNGDVLKTTYDFITCTETAEHFRKPRNEFEKFQTLLSPGGWLGLMTGRLPQGKTFAEWHYPKDPTHIAFYEMKTLQWIAQAFNWAVEFPAPNVALFQKPI